VLREKFYSFCHTEPNHNWQWFYDNFEKELLAISTGVTLAPFDANIVLEMLPNVHCKLLNLIQAVPVTVETRIFDAETPFSCYCFIRNLCLLSSLRIDLFDRYVDQTVFHRYLAAR
jgi:hypothetical protein